MSTQPGNALILGGKTGLLGSALTNALNTRGWNVFPVGRADFDPFDGTALREWVEANAIDVVFNTIAYTQVDLAEEQEHDAYRLNKHLPLNIGRALKGSETALVHYSTDFVFDGKKDTPYTTEDVPAPASVYGASKLAGEQALFGLGHEKLMIIRTSWLFGPGKTNFVEKILGFARDREKLTVVADQIGSPTYTVDLALNSESLLQTGQWGLYHLSSCGKASWCELAAEAISVAGIDCTVEPIPSSAYPQKAARPSYSVLDLSKFKEATGITPRPWAVGVRDYVYGDLQITEGD